MKYRYNRDGEKLSVLGYGCMRFTKTGGTIDLAKARREILSAVERGVNYFDTAYVYPGNEEALGLILEQTGIRDRVNVATKLPQYLIRSSAAIEKDFREELKRLRTDHIDYYLMHMMTDYSQWENLRCFGIEEWIQEKKQSGEIRHTGFSFHGNTDMFLRILNAYDWDFCQIQYNYLDEHTQAGRAGLEAAAAKGIPVIIMEPLRGGKLVNLMPEKAREMVRNHPSGRSAAAWGLLWLWDQPGVTCVLSGMNSVEMVEENCRLASEAEAGLFTESDQAFIEKLKEEIRAYVKVGCTGCRYCMPCPSGVDIPGVFRCYKHMYTESRKEGRYEYAQTIGLAAEPGFGSRCVRCGRCEKLCPQVLPIRDLLREADRALRPLPYRIGIGVVRKILLRKPKS